MRSMEDGERAIIIATLSDRQCPMMTEAVRKLRKTSREFCLGGLVTIPNRKAFNVARSERSIVSGHEFSHSLNLQECDGLRFRASAHGRGRTFQELNRTHAIPAGLG